MAYKEFSAGFKAFQKLRDECTAGLEKCNFIVEPEGLENLHFERSMSEYFSEEGDEHEFHEYRKGPARAVFLQTYVEREGGMYINGLYANEQARQILQKGHDPAS